MKGTRISKSLFDMIKGLLAQGNSMNKVAALIPDEAKVSHNTIRKVSAAKDYDEYCGVKKEEPEKPPEKAVQITPYAQTKEIVAAIEKTNILLESIFQMMKEHKEVTQELDDRVQWLFEYLMA